MYGCSLGSLDGFSGGNVPPDGGDGNAFDATDDGSTGREDARVDDASADSAPNVDGSAPPSQNVVINGDMEASGFHGCGVYWFGYNASVAHTSSSPHGGTYACRVCAADGGLQYDLDVDLNGWHETKSGTTFQVSAWARSTSVVTISMDVRLFPPGGEGAAYDTGTSGPKALAPNWQQLSFTYTAPQDGYLDVFFPTTGTEPAGSCYEIDDVEIVEKQ